MPPHVVTIELAVDPSSDDKQRTAQDTAALAAQLRQLEIESLTQLPSHVDPPSGTRSGAAAEVGSLVITALSTRIVLGSLIGLLRDWLGRRESGTVRVKIGDDELTLTNASRASQNKALDDFIARHGE